jgi:chromate reductase
VNSFSKARPLGFSKVGAGFFLILHDNMSSKITVISGTNRPHSFTALVSMKYAELLKNSGVEVDILFLEALPTSIVEHEIYGRLLPDMEVVAKQYIMDVDKFVFVVPEYNGSYPGIVKLFLDALPPRLWAKKKAGIIGVSSGAAGNLRGQEHLTGVLNYLKVNVHYNKPKLSHIEQTWENDPKLLDHLQEHVNQIIEF